MRRPCWRWRNIKSVNRSTYQRYQYGGCACDDTYIFSKQIPLPIIIHIHARVPTLKPKRPLAPQVRVLPANRVARRDADLGFAVVGAVDVHPEDVFVCLLVKHDFGALDDAAGTSVARCSAREQCPFVAPFYEIGGGVAVDVDEGCAVGFVFADPGWISVM